MKNGNGLKESDLIKNNKSFFEHLSELNRRSLLVISSIFAASIPSWFLYEAFVDLLLIPIERIGLSQNSLVVHQVTEALQVKLSVVIFLSFYICLPIIIYNIAAFLIPAASEQYKKISWFLTLLSLLFFYGGAFFAYYNLHLAMDFFFSFTDVTVGIRSQYYFHFIFRFILFIGIFFQFPIVVAVLVMNKVIQVSYLINKRREIFVLILFTAAVITPTGDPISLVLVTLPTYIFYELLIFILKRKFD